MKIFKRQVLVLIAKVESLIFQKERCWAEVDDKRMESYKSMNSEGKGWWP